MRFRFKKHKTSVSNIVTKLTITLVSLWVGGTIVSALGTTMVHTESPLYGGLNLIGWTVGNYGIYNASHVYSTCAQSASAIQEGTTALGSGCITATNAGTGILIVIGLIGIASVVLEFVSFKL